MSGYVKAFKNKDGDKDKNKKKWYFPQKLLEKYKSIWTKTEGLKNIGFNALPVYDKRYIKSKVRTYGDKVYTTFRNLNMPEDYMECESFTVISIDSLLVNKSNYYL